MTTYSISSGGELARDLARRRRRMPAIAWRYRPARSGSVIATLHDAAVE
jgi:hypothetical protein